MRPTYVCAHTGPGIHSHDDSVLKDEAKGCGAVRWLDVLHHLSLKVVQL